MAGWIWLALLTQLSDNLCLTDPQAGWLTGKCFLTEVGGQGGLGRQAGWQAHLLRSWGAD